MEMETNGISNHYIDRLMEQVSYNFRGTFSADNIPIFQEDFFSIIVNLSSEGEKGSHFIAISSSASKLYILIPLAVNRLTQVSNNI